MMAFSRPFCLGVTWTAAEVKKGQRDGRETAKKSDGTKTRSWAGATPLFGPSVSKVTHGVAPAHRRSIHRRVFGPVAAGREKRRELEEKKEEASAKGI